MRASALSVFCCALVLLGAGGGVRTYGSEDVAVADCFGKLHHPLELEGRKAAVFIFISRECPISNSLVPEINRITAAYTNFALYLVHADPDTKGKEASAHAKDFRLQAPVLLDPQHRLVKLAGATMTPEAVVLTAERQILYRGRINDLYAALGKKRAQPTRHDLRAALDAIASGKSVPNRETKVIGCYIPEAAK